jgi:cystathionine beta-lyase
MKFNTKVYTVANIQTQAQGCHPYIKQRLMHKQVPTSYGEYEYSRTANPTRTALENALARMAQEDWPSSGFSNRLFDAGLKPGDEVIAMDDLYGGTYRLFTKIYKDSGILFHL